jgi:hypothetical protein
MSSIGSLIVNFKIASDFRLTDGKGRLLYGLIELKYIHYHYIIFIVSLISLGVIIIAKRKKENNYMILLALIITFISFLFVFLKLWRLMV